MSGSQTQEIAKALECQVERYDQCLAELVAIQTDLTTVGWSSATQSRLENIVGSLNDDEFHAELRNWNQSQSKSTPAIRQLVDRVKSALQAVLVQVQLVEKTAREMQTELIPKMNVAARSRQAIRAYGRAKQP